MPATDALEAIRSRRTHKAFTGQAVPRPMLESLLELARWAPTHRLSEPWRFCVLEQPAIAKLMDFVRAQPDIAVTPDPAKGAAKLAKLLGRLPQAGALVFATWIRAADARIDLEDHASAAAAVQNVLLGCTAHGLASFWSTTAALAHPATQQWCGIDSRTEGFLGCIWIGYPVATPPAPPRKPLTERVRWL